MLLANMYGPRDRSTHVIPDLIRKLLVRGNLEVWGTGKQTRDFLHVRDAARAIRFFYDNPLREPVNIANGFSITIRQLVDYLTEFTGFQGEIIYNNKMPTGESRRAYNVDKATKHGYTTSIPIREGLKETVEWFKLLS